jgi:hypothetical protein
MDEGAAVTDVEHDQDTPGDSPYCMSASASALLHNAIYSHCWQPTSLPRLDGGAISVMYTGTWAEQIPTESPLMKRPTTSMPIF